MGKSMRSKAHRHKRTKRRERSQAHYDQMAEERAEVARKHLEKAEPVRDDKDKVLEQVERRREKERVAKDEKRRSRAGMQWEAMKPIQPEPTTTGGNDVAMEDLNNNLPYLRSKAKRDPSKARSALQGGKLLGVFRKTTKRERKNQKKRLKRHK
ncbi:hypothetical protein A3770_18p81800 [Chloropicon primus]|uniref:Uncharacterized protein n=1 Tax=Chloropicon primus TaxID=1764295 RepID=A0A5B8N0T8_9CHLO|nr:hypothetical protein A3770_18p81800 [Chloropicon primus]|mmetsp:Transcript_11423/g.31769  ORF Transcript_11423/g.31769 Transcript_11423/m.31769 type:complete len:154 (+) Transcript_11423:420-881(+)|eukprot:QDZ25662.1 hypothetical protein A3770_18p81800 [Chloropicon primus]